MKLPDINNTIIWPKRCEDKWSLTPSGTDLSYVANNIEAHIKKWYHHDNNLIEITGNIKIYKFNKETSQVLENKYNFNIENALNDSNLLSTLEERNNYMNEKVSEIIESMNLILGVIKM